MKRAKLVKPRINKGMKKRGCGNFSKRPGNSAKLTELVVTGTTKRVKVWSS